MAAQIRVAIDLEKIGRASEIVPEQNKLLQDESNAAGKSAEWVLSVITK